MLLLNFARALNEVADKNLRVAVYRRYHRRWHGLREGLIRNLVNISKKSAGVVNMEEFGIPCGQSLFSA